MMALGRLWRIGRHGNHTRIQAAEERRDVIGTAGEQQHCPITELGPRLQCCGDGPRPRIQRLIGQYCLLARVIGQKAQGDPLGGLLGALRQGLDQRVREFEGVRHGCSCQCLGKSGLAVASLNAGGVGGLGYTGERMGRANN
ncbi:hypothetical protein PS623_04366 [Pseudomonas fluorescens]|nr:hypothetical protein PS623_04366 [Pseudomonas fluorescens]